jgi:D,D-heptose 1,7-bisphosphate phosphatase
MKRPAVFFDRDNTLIANDGYLGDPAQVALLPGAAQAIARARKLGFAVVTVSNQSGVGRGLFTEEDVQAVNARMDSLLQDDDPDAVIERHEYCPFHPKATVERYRGESDRRKPAPGMILESAAELDIDLSRSWLVGDAPRDVEAGHRAGCRTVLLRDASLDGAESEATNEPLTVQPDYVAESLADAMDFIEMHHTGIERAKSEPVASSERVLVTPAPDFISAPQETFVTPTSSEPADPVEAIEPAIATAIAPASESAPKIAPSSTKPARAESPARPVVTDEVVLLGRIVDELRRGNDPPQDFSVAKVVAGVVQGLAIAAAFAAVLWRNEPNAFMMLMATAVFLQAAVTSLLLMR